METENRTWHIRNLKATAKSIVGYIPYDSLSVDMGGFREVLKPGCFSKSITNRDRVLSLWNHDASKPLGSTKAGTLTIEDKRDGLHFQIFPPSNSWGKSALESVKRGDIDGCSFGFIVGQDDWDERDGERVRAVLTARLLEISPCSFPAYEATQVREQLHSKEHNRMDTREKIIDAYNKAFELKSFGEDTDRERLTPDENREFLGLMTRYDNLNPEELGYPRFEDVGFEGVHRYMTGSLYEPTKPYPGAPNTRSAKGEDDFEVRAFNKAVLYGVNALDKQELRALQADSDPAGGFLVLPTQLAQMILKKKDNKVFIRKLATKFQVPNAASLGIPSLDNDPGDHSLDWSGEISETPEDTDMDFQRRDLHPHELKRLIKVSNKLLRMSNAGDLVTERLSYVFSIVEEYNFLRGHGSARPLGVFEVSEILPTSIDCNEDHTSSAIKGDGLIAAEAMLKEQYRANARWCFSRSALKRIRKMKTGDAQYLWIQGLQGSPSTILDYPYHISEYCPDTFEANQYIGILGDWSSYFIADALNMKVQVLKELYARTSQTGFLAESCADGMPTNSEAFVRIQLGS